MASKYRETVSKVKHNLLGTAIGGVGGFLIAKKVIKTDKTWLLVVVTVAGAVAGALVSAGIRARKGQPTKETVTTDAKK